MCTTAARTGLALRVPTVRWCACAKGRTTTVRGHTLRHNATGRVCDAVGALSGGTQQEGAPTGVPSATDGGVREGAFDAPTGDASCADVGSGGTVAPSVGCFAAPLCPAGCPTPCPKPSAEAFGGRIVVATTARGEHPRPTHSGAALGRVAHRALAAAPGGYGASTTGPEACCTDGGEATRPVVATGGATPATQKRVKRWHGKWPH